jgi:hypothetical protein
MMVIFAIYDFLGMSGIREWVGFWGRKRMVGQLCNLLKYSYHIVIKMRKFSEENRLNAKPG